VRLNVRPNRCAKVNNKLPTYTGSKAIQVTASKKKKKKKRESPFFFFGKKKN